MPTTITSSGITFNDATSQTTSALAANAIGTTQIADGSVNLQKLAAVTQARVAKAWVNFNGVFTSNATRSYSRSGSTITVTSTAHGLTTGNMVLISAATDTGHNGWQTITATPTVDTFQFVDASTGATTGTLTWQLGIRSQLNVSSITKNGTGDYTVNFTTPMADANYSILGSVNPSRFMWDRQFGVKYGTTPSVSSVNVTVGDYNSNQDETGVYVAIFGN